MKLAASDALVNAGGVRGPFGVEVVVSSPDVLVHEVGDDVAVAVADLSPGSVVVAHVRDDDRFALELLEEVPLGHKVALRGLSAGDDIVEYGVRVAVASADIDQGAYVHVHNVRSARWQRSSS